MRIRGVIASFVVGCGILIAAFGIGWFRWWQPDNYIGLIQILMGIFGVVVAFLVAAGILNRGRERWAALAAAATLLLGFSALTFFSLGILIAPVGLLLLGFSLWRLIVKSGNTRLSTH